MTALKILMPPFILLLYTLYPSFFFFFFWWWCCDFCFTSGLRSGSCQAHLNGAHLRGHPALQPAGVLLRHLWDQSQTPAEQSDWNYNASREAVFLPNCEVVQREEGVGGLKLRRLDCAAGGERGKRQNGGVVSGGKAGQRERYKWDGRG